MVKFDHVRGDRSIDLCFWFDCDDEAFHLICSESEWRREIALCFSENTEMRWRLFAFPPSLCRSPPPPAAVAVAPSSNWSAPRFSILIALTLRLVPMILAIRGALHTDLTISHSIDFSCYRGSIVRIVFYLSDP